MTAPISPERLGQRRLTWAEAEQQLLTGCRPIIEMALAAGMTGQPLDRTRLRLQLAGLQRVLASCTEGQPQQRTLPHETHPQAGESAEVKDANLIP